MGMMNKGIVLIAMGQKARDEAVKCIESIQAIHSDVPIAVLNDSVYEMKGGIHKPIGAGGGHWRIEADLTGNGRATKTCLYTLSPYDLTLYCDVDTRIRQPVDLLFDIVSDGFDMAITASTKQAEQFCWNAGEDEREATLEQIGHTPVQYQAGVFAIRKSPATKRFFAVWQREWLRFKGNDQAAFSRALHEIPLRIWLLGRVFNGGAVIEHHFGSLR